MDEEETPTRPAQFIISSCWCRAAGTEHGEGSWQGPSVDRRNKAAQNLSGSCLLRRGHAVVFYLSRRGSAEVQVSNSTDSSYQVRSTIKGSRRCQFISTCASRCLSGPKSVCLVRRWQRNPFQDRMDFYMDVAHTTARSSEICFVCV